MRASDRILVAAHGRNKVKAARREELDLETEDCTVAECKLPAEAAAAKPLSLQKEARLPET